MVLVSKVFSIVTSRNKGKYKGQRTKYNVETVISTKKYIHVVPCKLYFVLNGGSESTKDKEQSTTWKL